MKGFADIDIQISAHFANDYYIKNLKQAIAKSLNSQREKLQQEYTSLAIDQFLCEGDMEQYKGVLEDEFCVLDETQNLADELMINAKYKFVEIHVKGRVKRILPNITDSNASNIEQLKRQLPFNLESLEGFDAFDELRLINNAIKHQGYVTAQLADRYPHWSEGTNFQNLEETLERLEPGLNRYLESIARSVSESLI